MRKKVLVIILALACSMSFYGCKNNVNKYDSSISELRTNIFAAENANLRVSAITGRRESPYVLDGNSDSKVEFTVITITPSNFSAGKKYSYTAKFNGKEFSGDFLPHPFAPTLSADIQVSCNDSSINLNIKSDAEREDFTLSSIITESTISADKALTIALNKLKPQLKEIEVKGKLEAEIYVRLTENPIDNTGGYFWYVAFVGKERTLAVLLNCSTGDVCAIAN